MKNPILPPKAKNRQEATEDVIEYIERSGDHPIWFFDKCIFRWYEKYKYTRAKSPNFKGRHFSTIRCTGPFTGNFDYGRGIQQINISTHHLDREDETATFILIFTNVDDGCWEARREFENIELANDFLDKFMELWKTEVDGKYGMILPTEEQLNAIICKVGLWGQSGS